MGEGTGLARLQAEMARQGADALASLTGNAVVAAELAASIARTGSLVLVGMAATAPSPSRGGNETVTAPSIVASPLQSKMTGGLPAPAAAFASVTVPALSEPGPRSNSTPSSGANASSGPWRNWPNSKPKAGMRASSIRIRPLASARPRSSPRPAMMIDVFDAKAASAASTSGSGGVASLSLIHI